MQALIKTFRASTKAPLGFRAEAAGDRGALYFYDVIGGGGWGGGIDPKDVIASLQGLTGKPLDIYVNSPGGDVFDGIAIYNVLRRFEGTKTMHVDGLAASAASLVIMAGDEIRCAHNAQIMIHDPWAFAMGNATDLRATADLLEQTGETLVDTYAKRTKAKAADVRQWMADETWMDAATALERGFCDVVDEPAQSEPDQKEPPEARARAQALLDAMNANLSKRASPQKHPGQPGK